MKKKLFLYSTMSRCVEEFIPVDQNLVTIYSCGPTVYSTQHIGNMRSFFYVDFLKRVVRDLAGYNTKHVMNITDVGHLTGDNEGDADTGVDKMEKGAKKEGITVWEVAEKFTQIFKDDVKRLDCLHVDVLCKATESIKEQILMVNKLTEGGLTYIIAGDGIYCDTSKVEDYGKLLPPGHLEGIQSGSRVDDYGKKNPTDFALRKFSPRDEHRAMEWVFEGDLLGELITHKNRNSLSAQQEISRGFPGWHIECSSMAYQHLGEQIDIHTGGIEHIPVHHSNEIVQSEYSFCKKPRVKYWFHLQHLQFEGEKISKSIGNVTYIGEIIEKGFHPGDVRLYFLQAHYRSFQDFSWKGLEAAQKTRKNLIKKILGVYSSSNSSSVSFSEKRIDPRYSGDLYDSLSLFLLQDIDGVGMISHLHEASNAFDIEKCNQIIGFDTKILGLGLYDEIISQLDESNSKSIELIPENIVNLANQRLEAKQAKNFTLADNLRDEISQFGYTIQDTGNTYTLSKK